MTRPRFIVSASTGYLGSGSGNISQPPGSTFTVLDTLYLHRVVGLFRSEDQQERQRRCAEMLTVAEAKADALAQSLNEWAASA